MTTQPAVSPETLPVLACQGARVVTTELLAQLYGAAPKHISDNYLNNATRFEAGKHYYKLTGAELRAFKHRPDQIGSVKIARNVNALLLWTERGAARHAKMLDTEQAWEVFERLEDAYFRPTERLTMEAQTAASSLLSRLADDFLNARKLAEAIGFKRNRAVLFANHAVEGIHGISVLKLLRAEHLFPGEAAPLTEPGVARTPTPDTPTPRPRPASHPLPLQLRTDTYAPFIERALAARAERERIEQETGRHPSVREHAAALQAQGYRASLSLLNWFNYAVDALLPAIPEALRAGMGKPQVQRLRALERDLETAREDGYGAVRLAFQRLLARHDGPAVDLDAITAEVERILSPGADH